MHTKNILIIVSLSALFLSSCTQNAVYGNTLKVQGTKMRTTGAYGAQLLMCGSRSRAGTNHFEGFQLLKLTRELDGKATMSMQVDQVWRLESKLKGTPYAGVTTSGEGNREVKQSATFIIVSVNQKIDLLRELQKPENAKLVRMLSKQREPRIITALATTVNHQNKISSSLSAGGNVVLKVVRVPGGDVEIQAKTTNESTYKFSDNTVFAYEMSIPAWQCDTNGKLYIVDYVEDRLGTSNEEPMDGTSLNPHEAPIVEKNQIMFVD